MLRFVIVACLVAVAGAGCLVARDGTADPGDPVAGAGAGSAAGAGGAGGEAGVGGQPEAGRGGDGGAAGTGGVSGSGGSAGAIPDAGGPDVALPCPGATGTGKLRGATCVCGGECASGFCVDGVCCESACAGRCQTCAKAGSAGSCVMVEEGQKDPRGMCVAAAASSCGQNGACDGRGGCALHGAGTACGAAPGCVSAGLQGAPACDGMGRCVPATPTTCSPFICEAGACRTSCSTTSHCASGLTCIAAQCEGPRPNGSSCGNAGECASGFCVDNVCCNQACQGTCRSCALPQSRGSCQLVPAGAFAVRGECAAKPTSTCAENGRCNGQGACQLHGSGVPCGNASCVDGAARPAPVCNGAGQCEAQSGRACSPFQCSGGQCLSSCDRDADCRAPFLCVVGDCRSVSVLDIPQVGNAPPINGSIEGVWSQAPLTPIGSIIFGNDGDLRGTFRAMWTQAALVIAVDVQDADLWNDQAEQSGYDDDTVEIYIDADASRRRSLDGVNDHHFLFGYGDTQPMNVSLRRTQGVEFASMKTGTGYTMEILLPWATLGVTPQVGAFIGLDVHVNDDDNGGVRERKKAWFAPSDISYMDTTSYGRVRLAGP